MATETKTEQADADPFGIFSDFDSASEPVAEPALIPNVATIGDKCQHLFPLVRGAGVAPKHVHSRIDGVPAIPRQYNEWYSFADLWFPIPESWLAAKEN